VLIIHQDLEGGAQGGNVGTLGSGFSVDDFDGDASHRLKLPIEKMSQRPRYRGRLGSSGETWKISSFPKRLDTIISLVPW